jgi:hypothetical protein
MPKKYRQLDNGQGDASKPGPISSYTVREYPTRQQIAKAKTDKARRKPVKGYKQDQITKTGKIKLKFLPDVPYTSYIGRYKGAGSKAAKKRSK